MRKKVLFTLTALFAAIASLTAAPVTKAEASEMAKAFMMARGIAVEGDLSHPREMHRQKTGLPVTMSSTMVKMEVSSSCRVILGQGRSSLILMKVISI